MPTRDSVHDYRPDPAFPITSHLDPGITQSTEDWAIPQSARKAEHVLDSYHEAFCITAIAADDVKDKVPPPPHYDAEGWATLSAVDRRRILLEQVTWKDLVATAKALLDPKPAPDFKNLVEHREARPYLEALLRRCPDYFAIKDYFHDGKAIEVQDVLGSAKVTPDGDLKKVMGGFVAFRNFYVNGMLKALRDDGPKQLTFTHKMVGSVELNSDYDATVGGEDDVAAAHEFHRAFRAGWGVESAQLFDTNLYYRDWMTVKDQDLLPSKGTGKDASIQVQVLDFIGDIYGLVKIRRYTDPVEWAAFLEATKRGVTVPGLSHPSYTSAEAKTKNIVAAPSGTTQIPRFKRFECVDQIYQQQFRGPLLARTKDVYNAWVADGSHGADLSDDPLHLLWEYDKNSVLRAMAIAYIELGAKLRDMEADLKRKHASGGDFDWMQNDETGAVVVKKVSWGLEGMVEFQERASLLLSEAVLFANEAYNTQGSLWTVVGGQGGNAPANMSLEHFLQSFNEQIGDALKELQEHLAQVHEKNAELGALRKQLETAKADFEKAEQQLAPSDNDAPKPDSVWADVDAAQEKLTAAWKEILEKEGALKDAAKERDVAGFYRASKYEGRMREMLQRIVDDLAKDPMVKRRIELARKLFSDPKFHYDSKDLMLLTKESVMAGFFDKYVKQLLLLRKGKDSYTNYDSHRVNELAVPSADPVLTQQLEKLRQLRAAVYQGADRRSELTAQDRDALKTLKARNPLKEDDQPLLAELEELDRADRARQAREDKALAELLRELRITVETEVKKDDLTDKTQELMNTALSDANFKLFKDNAERKVTEIIYGAGAESYQTELKADPNSAPWGLRHLIQHLLHHCALVNQLYRKIKSRGPTDLFVGTFLEEPE